VSIHISGKLSGTFNSATQAAREPAMPCQVRVIDTESASMGLGLVVLEAAKAAHEGADLDTVAAIAADASRRCHCIAMLDTLEYLQRGGRIGKVRALLGTVLSIKPLIVVREGEVHELGMERTHRRALAKLESTALEHARARYFAVMYSTARDEAEALAKRLECAVPDCEQVFIAQFGPTVGTHVGPNALGVGILDRR
jgi:DegV family protein with EDD domain